jgi:hypothetical protein
MEKINNLTEFLAERGFETPYSWGRAMYKYVDCGPWVSFIMEDAPAITHSCTAIVEERNGEPYLTNYKRMNSSFLSFLAFSDDGTVRSPTTWGDYQALLENYIGDKTKHDSRKIKLQKRGGVLFISTVIEEPAKTHEVYYEDDEVETFDHARCIGVKVGSIVEGSDVEIEPYPFIFPFPMKEFDDGVDEINKQAEYYWHRDNSAFYYIQGDHSADLVETWGAYKWSEDEGDKLPEKDKKMLEEFVCTYMGDRMENTQQIRGYSVTEYVNDGIY